MNRRAEEEEDEIENKPTKRVKVIRSFIYLTSRVSELTKKRRFVDDSFYTSDWKHEFAELNDEELTPNNTPFQNTSILYERLKFAYNHLAAQFTAVRSVYVGKTCDITQRFSKNLSTYRKTNDFFVMVTLQKFRYSEIPKELDEWKVNVNIFGLIYENLLLQMIKSKGEIDCMDNKDESGGGGRSTSSETDNVRIYALFLCY